MPCKPRKKVFDTLVPLEISLFHDNHPLKLNMKKAPCNLQDAFEN